MSPQHIHDVIVSQEYPCGCRACCCFCGCDNLPYIEHCTIHAAAEDLLGASKKAFAAIAFALTGAGSERWDQLEDANLALRAAIDKTKEKPNGRATV